MCFLDQGGKLGSGARKRGFSGERRDTFTYDDVFSGGCHVTSCHGDVTSGTDLEDPDDLTQFPKGSVT